MAYMGNFRVERRKIFEFAIGNGQIKIDDVMDLLGCSEKAASVRLGRLRRQGWLRILGRIGHKYVYEPTDRLIENIDTYPTMIDFWRKHKK